MNNSIYELLMLICFGASWPISIIKSIRCKKVDGKSVLFLYIIVLGYIFGIIHKFIYMRDYIIILYAVNAVMVSIDIVLWHRYSKK